MAAVSWLLVAPIQAELAQWGQVKAGINGVLASWAKSLGVHQTVDLDHIGEQVVSFVTGQGLGNIVAQTAGVTTTVAVILAFVFIGSMYLLAAPRGQMSRAIVGLLPPWRRPAMVGAMRDLEPQLRWWLIGTLIGMVSIGAASLAGYALVGLHWALPLALFAGLAEAVPTVGPALTLVLAILLASAGAGPGRRRERCLRRRAGVGVQRADPDRDEAGGRYSAGGLAVHADPLGEDPGRLGAAAGYPDRPGDLEPAETFCHA